MSDAKLRKKVLILCNDFYPDSIIGAKRLSMFAYFLSDVFEVTVVRSGKIYGSASLFLNLHNKEHVSIYSFNGEKTESELIESGAQPPKVNVKKSKSPSKIKVFISKLIKPIKFYHLNRQIYLKTMRTIKNNIDVKSFDLIISTYSPLGSTSAAYHLKKKFNIPWIMDIRDVMDIPSRGFVIRTINSVLQKKYANFCDAITTPTFGFKKEIQEKTNTKSPVHVLYNGFYSFGEYSRSDNRKDVLHFCYTGTIHEDRCTLKTFAQAVFELIKEDKIKPEGIIISYAGANSGRFDEQIRILSNLVTINNFGYLNHEETYSLQQSSDVFLIMVMNLKKHIGVLSGKLAEGICLQKPLLGMVFGDLANSELSNIISQNGLGFCYENSAPSSFAQMKSFILKTYNRKMTVGDVSIDITDNIRQQFDYKCICNRLIDIVKEIIGDVK